MSTADELIKLSNLKDKGLLSDAEFQQQKTKLLNSGVGQADAALPLQPSAAPTEWTSVPLHNKFWFQGIITFLIIPVGVVLMLLCTAYQKRKGQVVRVGKGLKAVVIILALLLWALNIAKLVGYETLGRAAGTAYSTVSSGTSGLSGGVDASSSSAASTSEADASSLGACDDDGTKASVKQIAERNGQLQVVDMGHFQEVSCPALSESDGSCLKTGTTERYCNARLYLNTGTTNVKFRMFYGPSGKPLIEVQEGAWTDWSKMK